MNQAIALITDTAGRLKTPHRVTGGTAARFYGATRDLYDLDIDFEDTDVERVFNSLASTDEASVIRRPERFKDENWDLLLATVRIHGLDVDLCGATTAQIKGASDVTWQAYPRLKNETNRRLGGRLIPIIGLDDLQSYKAILSRPEDLLDLDELNGTKWRREAQKRLEDMSWLHG